MHFKMRSIRQRLMLLTSSFAFLLGAILLITAYRTALHESNEILDAQMRFLAEHSSQQHLVRSLKILNIGDEYHEKNLRLEITPVLQVGRKFNTGFYNRQLDGQAWRSYILLTQNYLIEVSQTQKVRRQFAFELAAVMLLPYLLILPIAMWFLAWIIGKGLNPLDHFKNEIVQRDISDLSAIDPKDYPLELHATILEMNRLLDRIHQSQQEQQQFVADAAHELRTPITALNLQTQILLSQLPEHEALQGLNKGLARMQHLVTQLLSLAKQDAAFLPQEHSQNFALNQVALHCVEQLMNMALQKDIDLGFTQNQDITMYSIEATVHSIIFNLIDNAIKYTPPKGIINIAVFLDTTDIATIVIEDSGSGIAPEHYEQVLKRFYRVHHHLEVGSGLGLSIVQRATKRLGGSIDLARSVELGGLQVTVKLPTHVNAVTEAR